MTQCHAGIENRYGLPPPPPPPRSPSLPEPPSEHIRTRHRGKGQRSARAGGGCPPHLTRRRPLEARPPSPFPFVSTLIHCCRCWLPQCGWAPGWFVFGGASRSVLLLLTLHRAGGTNGRREGGKRKYEGKQKRATSGQGTILQKERKRK